MVWRSLALFLLSVATACDACRQDPLVPLVPLGAVQPTLDMGRRYLGVAIEQSVSIASQGTAPLSIANVTIEGADFSLVGDHASDVPVGDATEVTVSFIASAIGPAAGVLRIETNAQNGPTFVVTLSGEGIPDAECPPDEACRVFRFDRATGSCVQQQIAGPCDDRSLCTSDDHCDDGVCVGVALQCPTLNECGRGVCDPVLGCFTVGDPNLCDDDDPCTEESCGDTGACSNDALPEGSPCGDFPACVIGTCQSDICTHAALPDGTPCDDRHICTAGDLCQGGQCIGARSTSEPAVVGVATSYGLGEPFLMPDPAGYPSDLWFFSRRTDVEWLMPQELRDVRAVRADTAALTTLAVGAVPIPQRSFFAVARFADGLVALTHSPSGVTYLSTFDIVSTAAELNLRGDLALASSGGTLAADGSRAFAYVGNALQAYDLSDPALPVETSSVAMPFWPTSLLPLGERLFQGHSQGLDLFDVAGGSLSRLGGDTATGTLALALSDQGVLALRSAALNNFMGDHIDVLDPTSGALVATLDVEGRGVTSLAAHGDRAALFGAELELIALPGGEVLDRVPFGVDRTIGMPQMSSALVVSNNFVGPTSAYALADDQLTPVTAPDQGNVGKPTRTAPGTVVTTGSSLARRIDVSDALAPRFTAGGVHDLWASLALLDGTHLAPAYFWIGDAGGASRSLPILDLSDLDAPTIASARALAAVENGRFVFVRGTNLIALSARQPGFACDVDCIGTGRVVLETFDLSALPPFPYPRIGSAVLPDAEVIALDDNSISVDVDRGLIATWLGRASGGDRIIVGDVSDAAAPRLYPPLEVPDFEWSYRVAVHGDRLYVPGYSFLHVFQIGATDITLIGTLARADIPGAAEQLNGFPSTLPLAVDDEVLVLGFPGVVAFIEISTMPPVPIGSVDVPLYPYAAVSDDDRLVITGDAEVMVLMPGCPP